MSLSSFFGKIFHGDEKIKHDFWKLRDQSRAGYAFGDRLTKDALGSLDQLDQTFQDQINRGGLPEYVSRAFDMAEGRISDDYARSNDAFEASLRQRALQTGGRISPEAVADMEREFAEGSAQGLFDARKDLGINRAGLRLENTNALFDQIMRIREAKLGTGQAEKARGQAGELAVDALRLDRNKAIASILTSVFGSFAGGGTGGFGG